MNIVYLQVDCRFNHWLLQRIDEKYVIEHTLSKIKKLNCEKIVAGIYDCQENAALIETLRNEVEVVLSNDENVTTRFLDLVMLENVEYIIRVGGDQLFLEAEKTNQILEEMKKQKKEFFYHTGLSSVLPDIVSLDCLNRRKTEVLQAERYFHALCEDDSVERYTLPNFCTLLYDFRASSNVNYRICKSVINKNLDIYELSLKLSDHLRYRENYLAKTGLMGSWILGNSYEDFFRDEDGNVNPWWGKTIIDLVVKKLSKDMRVFEWGMGNSTLFWSQYVGEVVSIESDLYWYKKMSEIIPRNVRAQYCELEYGGEYCQKIIDEQEKFDIILIDGRDRVRCAINSLEKLKENGIIIWDNTDRDEYRDGYAYLKEQGFKKLELSSVIYGAPGVEDYTSVFYREDNILEL
ncbi:MAG: hypothetical protein OSJ60_03925 [Lachnospiraceae bacterium]|nr:hypothetical protein [Lachnospiraceae bacterium]